MLPASYARSTASTPASLMRIPPKPWTSAIHAPATAAILAKLARPAPFQRPALGQQDGKGPATFDFLGFTLYWRRTRWGRWR